MCINILCLIEAHNVGEIQHKFLDDVQKIEKYIYMLIFIKLTAFARISALFLVDKSVKIA